MRVIIGPGREDIARVQQRILEVLKGLGYDQAACFAVRTAVEEAVSNATRHGNNDDPDRTVTIEYAADPASVVIDVQDEGLGFEPGSVPDPTRPENVDIPSGRGIMLMQVYMTEVIWFPPGNKVRLRLVRADSGNDPPDWRPTGDLEMDLNSNSVGEV